jgi:hypothetical protein
MGRKESLFVVRFQLNTIKVLDYHATTQSIKLEKARGTVITRCQMVGLTTPRHGRPAEKILMTRRWSDLYEKRGTAWALIGRTELATPLIKSTPMTLLVHPK